MCQTKYIALTPLTIFRCMIDFLVIGDGTCLRIHYYQLSTKNSRAGYSGNKIGISLVIKEINKSIALFHKTAIKTAHNLLHRVSLLDRRFIFFTTIILKFK